VSRRFPGFRVRRGFYLHGVFPFFPLSDPYLSQSINDTPETRRLFARFNTDRFRTAYMIGGQKAKPTGELIVAGPQEARHAAGALTARTPTVNSLTQVIAEVLPGNFLPARPLSRPLDSGLKHSERLFRCSSESHCA
jgi:hypothetical protein